jgi:FMN phosphatase YigB (HAD superfamily)
MDKPDQPWVWFDVDDVVVESTPLFQESMDRWTGKVIPWQTWTHNRFHQFYGVRDDDADTIAQMKAVWKADQVLERSPLRPGVVEAMRQIHDMGCRLGFLTARAWHEEGVAITQSMAVTHRLPVDRIISMEYTQTKAEFLAQTGTRVIGFVDDTIRHVEGCRSAGFDAVLMDQPWNVEAVHLPRVKDMGEFAQHIARVLEPLALPSRRRRMP